MADFLILQKQVDRSVLREGMSIPVAFQELFYEKLGFSLRPGEERQIRILIGSEVFPAKLKNLLFDRTKYPDHTDILQIRYSPKSRLAVKLRAVFAATQLLVEEYENNRTDRRLLRIPESQREYIALYATPVSGDILMECISKREFEEAEAEICTEDEFAFETSDPIAGIILRPGIQKIRKLSRAIGDNLKQVYQYRCQICGQIIGEAYGSKLIHAHHIDYFTKSLNNDADNVMIVCPNHHGIIHEKNPRFDRTTLTYTYPNGYREGLLLNRHL